MEKAIAAKKIATARTAACYLPSICSELCCLTLKVALAAFPLDGTTPERAVILTPIARQFAALGCLQSVAVRLFQPFPIPGPRQAAPSSFAPCGCGGNGPPQRHAFHRELPPVRLGSSGHTEWSLPPFRIAPQRTIRDSASASRRVRRRPRYPRSGSGTNEPEEEGSVRVTEGRDVSGWFTVNPTTSQTFGITSVKTLVMLKGTCYACAG